MNVKQIILYSLGILLFLNSCCGSNDDVPIDNTTILHVFNLGKTDNLLDYSGPIIFDTIKLRYADNNEELNCLTNEPARELAFLPLNRQQELESVETSELILELDSLSYTINITYEVEEVECAGTKIRVQSYNFEGQEFQFDNNLRYNTIELLINI